jgi:hypothetical protein
LSYFSMVQAPTEETLLFRNVNAKKVHKKTARRRQRRVLPYSSPINYTVSVVLSGTQQRSSFFFFFFFFPSCKCLFVFLVALLFVIVWMCVHRFFVCFLAENVTFIAKCFVLY